MAPGELLELAGPRCAATAARWADGEAASAAREDGGFAVTLAGGCVVRARRLLVATGLADELPELPGLRERRGRDVVHCPYCHGWQVRDRAIGVLASGPCSVHQALLFRQLSDDVTHSACHFADRGGGGAAGGPRHPGGRRRGGVAGHRF